MTTCTECGFVYEDLAVEAVAATVAAAPAAYREALAGHPPGTLLRHPGPTVWSALEYTCHARDVLLVQRDRVVRALVEDRPAFERMHRDERVALCAYETEEPDAVLAGLAVAADLWCLLVGGLDAAGWCRPLDYNLPDARDVDVTWLARRTVHEVTHHLDDVRAVLRRVGSPA
jgi:DNA segregation ATPase FtsK/SpoIIIE, S-DNA-T family